jgi:O-antigen ligase
VQGPLKTFLLYLLPLPLAAVFSDRAGRAELERWTIRLAMLGSAFLVVRVATGQGVLSEDQATRTVISLTEQAAATRVRAPVLGLVFVATLLVVARIASAGWRLDRAVQLALFTAVLALSFNRSTWVPLIVCLLVLLRLRPGERVPGRGLATSAAAALVAPALFLAMGAGALGPTGRALHDRVASAGNPAVVQEASFDYRTTEYEAASRAITRSPLVGVGIARPFGVTRYHYLDRPPRLVPVEQLYIHNGLLGTWLQLGLLGVAATLWLWFRVVRAARLRRTLETEDATRTLVGAVAVLGFALQSMLQTNLNHRPTIIALSIALVLADPTRAARHQTSD